jgi:hypothetical protein
MQYFQKFQPSPAEKTGNRGIERGLEVLDIKDELDAAMHVANNET